MCDSFVSVTVFGRVCRDDIDTRWPNDLFTGACYERPLGCHPIGTMNQWSIAGKERSIRLAVLTYFRSLRITFHFHSLSSLTLTLALSSLSLCTSCVVMAFVYKILFFLATSFAVMSKLNGEKSIDASRYRDAAAASAAGVDERAPLTEQLSGDQAAAASRSNTDLWQSFEVAATDPELTDPSTVKPSE